MELAAKLDDFGRPAWIGVMVLGFILFWPIGLAILAYLIWSGRMGCWTYRGPGRWHNAGETGSTCGRRGRRRAHKKPESMSGNHAFDEYREETMRRLEDEQIEFESFLERLRHAKDKAEFDQFMNERRDQPPAEEGGASNPPEGPTA